MTSTARGQRYRLVYGIQSAEGTPQVTNNALWESSMFDGSIEPVQTVQPFAVSDTDDAPPGFYTEVASSAGDPTILCDAHAFPALYYLHLGSVSGAGTTHTITRADSPVFGTFMFMRPDVVGGTDRWGQMSDGFVRGIELTAAAGTPLKAKLDLMGKTHTFNITAPVPTASPASGVAGDYRLRGATGQGGALTMIGATLKLDLDATPATTTIHNVKTAVLNSQWGNYNLHQTDALTPTYWDKGPFTIAASLDILFQDFAAYASTFFGTKTVTSNMTQSATVVYGSCDFLFQTIAGTGSRSLEVQLPNLAWDLAPPKLDVSGAAVTATLTAQLAAVTTPITVISINSRTGVYTSGP